MNTKFRHYHFTVDNQKYIYDGNTVSILVEYESELMPTTNPSTIPSEYRSKFLNNVVLTLTNNCNLSCNYCFANKGLYDVPHKVMSFETAKKSIDLTLETVIKNNGNRIRIGFFGGEPLLEFELIKKIVNYVEIKTPADIKKEYIITTNGTLINEAIAKFFSDNKFVVTISIDGNREYHDYFRKYKNGQGSYYDVLSSIKLLLPLTQVIARITINENNPNIHDHINHLTSIGVNEITYAYDYKISDNTFSIFQDSIGLLFNNYYNDIRSKKYYNITNITRGMISIALNLKTRSHCSACISYLSVSADGQIYHCPRFTGSKTHTVGKIENLNFENISHYTNTIKDSIGENAGQRTTQCSNCAFLYLCGGICYHQAYSLSNDSDFTFVDRECSYRKELFKLTLELICKLSIDERKDFMNFISTYRNLV